MLLKTKEFLLIAIIFLIPFALFAQIENWVYRYNGPGNSNASANTIAYGTDGNVYAAGASIGHTTGSDITVISLDSLSQTRWIYRYNGSGNGNDAVSSVISYLNRTVYVAGAGYGTGTDADFTVISLTNYGRENWVYNYNGLGSGEDKANAITCGPNENIYAAGYSTGNITGRDFTVISLTISGQQKWVYRYNGAGNNDDKAYAIVFGFDGNIYVSGTSYDNNSSWDITVVSLDTIGHERWIYRYNGPASSFDYAYSIVYGNDGNIYVAGYSTGIDWDFTVISLTNGGQERWVYRYEGIGSGSNWANSIIYGGDGNIYAGGYTTGNNTDWDFTVISLTNTGQERWIYTYNGPGNNNDRTNSIVYGADGNIYATGWSIGNTFYSDLTVISLTSAGQERWVYRYNTVGNTSDYGYSIVWGIDGKIYIAGEGVTKTNLTDFTVIKLNSLGQELWVYKYNGPGRTEDRAHSIIYGSDGNIYVAGESGGTGTLYDFTIISLNSSGQKNWVYRYNGPVSGYDIPYSMVQGVDGNLYAGGYSADSGTGPDFIVISTTNSGTERWVYRYPGSGNHWEVCYSVDCGEDGNIYAGGYVYNSGTENDLAVISFDAEGQERWVYRYNGPENLGDDASSIVYGGDGNIYAAGGSWSSGSSTNFTVVSLDNAGQERWIYHYNGPGNGDDDLNSIAYGNDGNIYAAGNSVGIGTKKDFIVLSLDTAGNERWIYRYNGLRNEDDWAYSVIYGSDGNIYAVGSCHEGITSWDFTVVSLTTDGQQRWIYQYNGSAYYADIAYSIVCGSDGNLYVGGKSYGAVTHDDLTVISLTTSGQERWVYNYDGPWSSRDVTTSIGYGAEGNVYAAGESSAQGTGADIIVISLGTVVGVEDFASYRLKEPKSLFASTFFKDNIYLKFSGLFKKSIKIKLYNIYGSLVFEKAFSYTPSLLIIDSRKIKDLQSGIYFISVLSEEKVIGKLKLLKCKN